MRWSFALVVVLVSLIGCTREPTPISLTGDQLMVHSLIRAGADTVHVHVSRSLADPIRDPNRPGGFIWSRPVSGADVRLVHGQESFRLTEAPAGFSACGIRMETWPQDTSEAEPGCYAGRIPGGIRPGDEYRLEVNLGPAGSASGRASVPSDPQILGVSGRMRQTMPFGAGFWGGSPAAVIPVRYDLAPQVNGISVGLLLDEVYRGGRRMSEARCSSASSDHLVRRTARSDSTRLQVHSAYCHQDTGGGRLEEFVPDSVIGRILLTGFDSTYVRYAEAAQQSSAERTRLQAGVTGALGVFAGAATVSYPIVLIPTPGGR